MECSKVSLEIFTKLFDEASKLIAPALSLNEIEQIRAKYFGKKGILTGMFKKMKNLPKEKRPAFGQKINDLKEKISNLLQLQIEQIRSQEIKKSLARDSIDITLPACGQELGSMHPITKTRYAIEDIFLRMGFIVEEGPEIEDDYHNFTALNFPAYHPARDLQDTFYLKNDLLLRTHTSPVQIRTMQKNAPPFRVIVPGRVYRCDSDATHSPMFHQIEGFIVDRGVNFTHLKWLLRQLIKDFFGEKMPLRFRPSFFPFTEPSLELDLLWRSSSGKKCWLEVCGAGMIHPNVLKEVKIDEEVYSGFAFGMGLDRLSMLRYSVDDLRMFFDNDIKFLEQF